MLAYFVHVRAHEMYAKGHNNCTFGHTRNAHGGDDYAVREMQQLVKRDVHIPPGYSIAWSGQFEFLERATERLKVVVPATIAGTGSEVMRRIAAPMVGGMVTAMVLSMLVVPAAYLLIRRPSSTLAQRGQQGAVAQV